MSAFPVRKRALERGLEHLFRAHALSPAVDPVVRLAAAAAADRALLPAPAAPPASPPPPPSAEDLVAYVAELAEGYRAAGRKPDLEASPRAGKGGRCAVCTAPRELRSRVEGLLCDGLTPHAVAIAVAPGPSEESIRRHSERCIPTLIRRHRGADAAVLVERTEARVEELLVEAKALLEEARKLVEDADNDAEATPRDRAATITTATRPLAEMRANLELIAKIRGELTAAVDVRVVLDSPRFAAEKEAIVKALLPYPEAAAVAAALRGLDV